MSILRTQDLHIRIGGIIVCRGLDLAIEPGQCWAVLGRNGAGKTTLIHTLAGLRKPDAGRVSLDGEDLARLGPAAIARRLGVLFQLTGTAFPGKVFETALSGRHPHLRALQWEGEHDWRIAREALARMDLASLAARDVQSLSGGEQRRLDIATLLTQQPDMYLLDEPLNHLDLRHQIRTLSLFRGLADGGAAVLMSLHDANLAWRYCDHCLLMMGDGECLTGGTGTLLTTANLERLYQHPMKEIRDGEQRLFVAGP